MLKLVVFDFDGVIAQTFEMCLGLNHMVEPDITPEEYRTKFEGNINKAKAKSGSQRIIDFFAEYEKRIFDCALTPGIADVIKQISVQYNTAICSSTINHPIELFLDHHGLLPEFNAVYGNDIDPSKVVKLKMLLDKFSITKDESIFITDTLGDIKEANEVGIKTIAVTWGYHDRERLAKGKTVAILDKPEQIMPEIANFAQN